MIYTNVAQAKDVCLVTLAIRIRRANGNDLEAFFNGFTENPRKARALIEKWAKGWIKQELSKFSNQREAALREVGMQSTSMMARIECLRRISKSGSNHAELCRMVVKYQEEIRLLVPSPNSRHYFWGAIMEEIIHYAHQQNARSAEIKHHYEQTIHQQ